MTNYNRGIELLAEITEDSIPLFDNISASDARIIRKLVEDGFVFCNGLAYVSTDKGHAFYNRLKNEGFK